MGKRDVDRAAHGDVAAGRDEALVVDQLRGGVDGERLHDAVEVERDAGRAREDAAGEPHLAPAPAQRRIDEAVRLGGDLERDLERAREERRDRDDRARRSG